MSRPGDPGREQILLAGSPADIVTQAIVQLRSTVDGIRSFEIAYDVPGRQLAVDEEPRPDETVVWTATVVVRRRWPGTRRPADRDFVGTATCPPGSDHGRGQVEAIASLLESFGANVVVV
jgi:hypothetical protein